MEGGVSKLARSNSGPFQDQKGEEVTVTIPPVARAILIRAPVSDDLEDIDDVDKESVEGEGEEEEEYFESASERTAGSPVGSFTFISHSVAVSASKVRDSDFCDSDSSSSSSLSSSSSASRRPRIRPVAKLSGDDDEEQAPREELVHELEEEEGFTVAKVPPLGFVKEGFLESVEMAGNSEGYTKAFMMGTETPELFEPRAGDWGLQQGLALGEPEVVELYKGGVLNDGDGVVENSDGKKESAVVDDGEVVNGSRSLSEQDGVEVAAKEGKEPGNVIEGVMGKAGVGVEGSGNDESDGVGIVKAVDGSILLNNNDAENAGTAEREFLGVEEEKCETDGIQGAEEISNTSQVEEVVVGQDGAGENSNASQVEDVVVGQDGVEENPNASQVEDVIVGQDVAQESSSSSQVEDVIVGQDEAEENSSASQVEDVIVGQDGAEENYGASQVEEVIVGQDGAEENSSASLVQEVIVGQDGAEENFNASQVQEVIVSQAVVETAGMSELDGMQGHNGGLQQAVVEEYVPDDVDFKVGDDKGEEVLEPTINASPETGVDVQAADKEDASDDSESKLVKDDVTADAVKAIDCSSVKEDCTQDMNVNENYDAQDTNVNEVATVQELDDVSDLKHEEATVEQLDYAPGLKHKVATVEELDDGQELTHEVATVEQLDDAQELKHEVPSLEKIDDAPELKHQAVAVEQLDDSREIEKEDTEESMDVVKLTENIGSEVSMTNAVTGGEGQGATSKSEFLPYMTETSNTTPQSNFESYSGDNSIQKAADGDGEMLASSDLCAPTEIVGCAENASLVDSNFEKVGYKELNASEAYDTPDKANEVASASYVTSQPSIDKEAIFETGSAICDQSLLKSESNQGFVTPGKPDDTQKVEEADMHQVKAVENQTVKGLDFTDGTAREESKFGLESRNSQSGEESKEAMLGSFEPKEHSDSSKPGASPDDSDTLMKPYFPTFDQDNKDSVLDDEETLASFANPQFTFEASSGDESIQKVVGRMVTDWDDEEDDGDDDEDEEMVDPSALAALMEVASSAVTGSNNSSFGAAGYPASTRPAGLGASIPSLDPMPRHLHNSRTNGSIISRPSLSVEDNQRNGDSGDGFDETQEKLQMIRVKFLRVVQRLGQTPQNVVVTQVLYRLGLAEGLKRGSSANRGFNSDRAITIAAELEAARQEDLDFTCNILVLGKSGVGKSATINSIFDESMSATNAFKPATDKVREIVGSVHGIKVRVVDTPGLMPSSVDQRRNRNIILSVKNFIKKCPPDIVLYFDRLDVQSRDYSDLPLLKLVTETFGAAIWFNTIVVLTHASSAPPDGANGAPLSYDMFVAQRSHIVQHSIRQAAGDMRLMNPVSLVENHSACRRNREGQRVLPNGQVWKPQLLLLCLSSKVLAEANALLKLQDSTPGKPLGLRTRAPPLPFLLSSLLQSRAQLKAPDEEGEEIDSDEDPEDVSDSEGEDEYDRLPPFKNLTKSQLSELTKEQREAYYDEKYYREKLYQKKQWKEELRRRREMKKRPADDKAKSYRDDESGLPEPEPGLMPEMAMPQTFDSDNPTYRYRYLDSASKWLVRPVLDTNGWDHDIGYDGVNVERMLVIKNKIPASVSGQITKDKKEANFQMECATSLKHGEHGATLASFDVQSVGRGLAYTLRSETRFSNFKCNKTAGGLSLTYLGNTLATGMKLEDSLTVGKRLKFVVNGGAMMGRGDMAYGGSLEVTLRDKDYPIGQMLTTLGVSVMNWHGDLAIGGNLQSQFAVGRKWKIVTRANLNNRRSGQISIRTSSSEQLQIALIGLIPIIRSLIRGRLFDPHYSA